MALYVLVSPFLNTSAESTFTTYSDKLFQVFTVLPDSRVQMLGLELILVSRQSP